MAKTTDPDTVVIVDDELQNVLWMVDYFDAKGILVTLASNVNEGVDRINEAIYRALVIDLNIPVLEPYEEALALAGTAYVKFPGLFLAKHARNRGYRDRQVIIYSVHRDTEVVEEAKRLGCTYIIKGRPREIKAELEAVLSYDPTTDDGGQPK